MPQNEHKKVLKELTEAYDAVYSEGLPGVTPGDPSNRPPGATGTQWAAAKSTDSRQAYKDAYDSWYYEFDTDMRYGGNDSGPPPNPAEYGLSEAEAKQVKEEHRKEYFAKMSAILDKARQSRWEPRTTYSS